MAGYFGFINAFHFDVISDYAFVSHLPLRWKRMFDFTIITLFEATVSLRLHLGLDTSTSMAYPWQAAQSTIARQTNDLDSHCARHRRVDSELR